MKHDITHSCGHPGRVDLLGRNSERERKLDWYINFSLCPDCFWQFRSSEKLSASTAAAQANRKSECAKLEGSDAQIAYAETVRYAHLAALGKLRRDLAEEANQGESESAVALPVVAATLVWAREITSAKWWLDNRAAPSAGFLPNLFSRRKAAVASETDMIRELLTLSPHMCESAAEALGVAGQWRAVLIRAAKAAAAAEQRTLAKRELRDATELAKSLGWHGQINRWQSCDGRQFRLYLNGTGCGGVVHFKVTDRNADGACNISPDKIQRVPGDPESVKAAAAALWFGMQANGKTTLELPEPIAAIKGTQGKNPKSSAKGRGKPPSADMDQPTRN
jgi:hypothetical protein